MNVRKNLLCILLGCISTGLFSRAWAQTSPAASKTDIEYDGVYDDPYDLNKLWLHFYPLYGDAFKTNFNVGFGGQANYYLKNKFDFRFHVRKTYAAPSDFSRGLGEKNSVVDNKLSIFKWIEAGATYHIIDNADPGDSKIIVYTKRYSANKWASTVPEHIRIPSKVRKIVGVRLGSYFWESATNLSDALVRQNKVLLNATGDTLSRSNVYTNIHSTGIYLGGSLARIRNVVVKPKKYDIAVNDIMFTAYADLIYAPMLRLDDVKQDGVVFPVNQVKLKNFGFRTGFDGMFNREFGWSYGAEMGYRPSIQGRGFYAAVKVGFAFASKLQQQRQSFQVDKTE
jgi:hypothetical protein